MPLAMDRAQHLAWAKKRALEELDRGSTTNALASMISDLRKHPETEGSSEIGGMLMAGLLLGGGLRTPEDVRKWIEGFN